MGSPVSPKTERRQILHPHRAAKGLATPLGVPVGILPQRFVRKTRMVGLPDGEKI